ncbi:hypothetical protein DFH07DRAFT_704569, partial [Mycena maculata]
AVLVDEARQNLRMMPWGWAKPPGLSDGEPLYHLSRFLGPNWLTGSQQNDMLELLRHKVDDDGILSQKIRILGVALAPKLLEAHAASGQTYRNAQSFRWLRDAADDLVRNKAALITTAHLGEIKNEPHWIGLVFDLSQPTGKILYGDSFGDPIPASLLAACLWWMGEHTQAHLELDKLPIASQRDGFSCGMLVDNAHQH